MNRASLLGTASIKDPVSMEFARIATAYKPPSPPVDFSDIPVEQLMRVESVFRMLADYKLGLVAQTRCFGMDISTIETTADLREVVHLLAIDRKNPTMLERIECLETIGAGLTKKFGAYISGHLMWLATEPSMGMHKHRDTLETGTLSEIQELAQQFRPLHS